MSHHEVTFPRRAYDGRTLGAGNLTAEQAMINEEGVARLLGRVAELERMRETSQTRRRRQLELATQVHRSLLPKPVRHEQIEVDVRYIPLEQVGGDYCQVRFADEDNCYITMCDVTGHGIGPGLLATRVSSEVRHGILDGRAPRDIVQSLNTFIRECFGETGLYLSFIAARIDLQRRQITWSGAGHPSPLLIRREGLAVERLGSQNTMIGVLEEGLDEDPQHTFPLEPGDRLVFYTDGVTETADANGRQLGIAGLADIATVAMSVDLFDMADRMLDLVAHHQHGPTMDDKTLIVAEVK